MALEIERKFLVIGDQWRDGAHAVHYRQGYLATDTNCAVRVRIAAQQAYLTIKGASRADGLSRAEYEYPIPYQDAEQMLDELCVGQPIEKLRYRVEYAGMIWEVDEFSGANVGLIVAEIELVRTDQVFAKPVWVGTEVTGDSRYYNASLARCPYTRW